MKDDLATLDAVAQAQLVQSKQMTALELVDAAIERIELLEPKIHAIAASNFELARERAKEPIKGPLSGVPFLVKDLLPYPGLRCCFGSRLFQSNVASKHSAYTAKLEQSGLITLGSTTTSEFGLLGSTEAKVYGTTHNPLALDRSAAGSSGGSAAAVASGMVAMAHANDGGGSIRIPASFCGLFGFKPSRGRCVSTEQPAIFELVIDHCVSRSVRDSALLLSVTENTEGTFEPIGYVQPTKQKKLTIGYYSSTLLGASITPEAQQVLEKTVQLCASLGHTMIPTTAPDLQGQLLSDAFFGLAGAGLSQLVSMMEPMLGRSVGPDDFEPFTLELVQWFRGLPTGSVESFIANLQKASAVYHAFLESFDVVLTPTTPLTAPELGYLSPNLPWETIMKRMGVIAGYTPIHNMSGCPAMSVPLFSLANGLPLGSHFTAKAGHDRLLLELAYQLEQSQRWNTRL